jgi:hypothetical protein
MDSLIRENASLQAQTKRLTASLSSERSDGLDLTLQIRFKPDELSLMECTIATRDVKILNLEGELEIASLGLLFYLLAQALQPRTG